jgi:hypothetical protein
MTKTIGNGIYQAIVKDNNDPQRMGRLSVWIPEFGGDDTNRDNWFLVSAASPFAGATPPNDLKANGATMDDSQQSYGFWMIPPDAENHVLVCFVNGDTARGFWFACLWQQNMNHMVPGLAAGKSTDSSLTSAGTEPPVVEYNKRSNENPKSPRRPTFEPLHEGLTQEGLYGDRIRGASDSSARREAPSKVFGFSTPQGNSIYIDDTPENAHIRLRTRTGAQIVINDTVGLIYINSSNGNSWAEISDKGIDLYSRGTISARSEGSINIHADGSMNLEADGNLNLRAGGNLTFQSVHHTQFATNGNYIVRGGGTISYKSGANLLFDSAGDIRAQAGKDISGKAGASVHFDAVTDITAKAGGENVRTASNIRDNSGADAPFAVGAGGLQPSVEVPRKLPDINGGPPWDTAERLTILRRMPTHEPFEGHPQSLSDALPDYNQPGEIASTQDSKDTTDTSIVPPGGEAKDVPPQDLTVTELDWLTCCMLDEAGNQSSDGLAAVAQVIKNRMAVKSNLTDGTIKGTVLAKDQFSGFYFDTVNGRYQRVCNDKTAAEKRGIAKIQRYKQNATKWNKAEI